MKRGLIIGAGFAGIYAAISAARLRNLQGVSPDDLEIALIAPEPSAPAHVMDLSVSAAAAAA